jgi:ribosomal protein S6--L-glutamate ligase
MSAFDCLGGDVVVKPLFGSEGRGMVRVTDRELAWRTFFAIEQTGGVIYLQRFVRHPGWDVRAFVLNGRVIAAMKRIAHRDWRTNVAQGGTAERFELAAPEVKLAVAAAAATGTIVAGVDLLMNDRGEWLVIEVNAVPGWRALCVACEVDVAREVMQYITELGDFPPSRKASRSDLSLKGEGVPNAFPLQGQAGSGCVATDPAGGDS